MIALIISSIIAFIAIAMLIMAFASDDGDLGFTALIILVFAVVLGFGVFCNAMTETSTEVPIEKFTYAKTESVLVIQAGGTTKTFTDAFTYNSISDSSKVFLRTDYDIYGGEIRTEIIVK